MEQLAARWAHNPKVVGSSPAPATEPEDFFLSAFFILLISKIMFTVYALYSEKHHKIYIGMTSNLEKRFFAHNNLPKGWTANFRPWKLVHTEEFSSKEEALLREKELKSARGRESIWNVINEKL